MMSESFLKLAWMNPEHQQEGFSPFSEVPWLFDHNFPYDINSDAIANLITPEQFPLFPRQGQGRGWQQESCILMKLVNGGVAHQETKEEAMRGD